jgi:NADPH-dependent curcumin reductase CurA
MNVMTQSLTMQGFIIFRMEESHPHLLEEFYEKVPSLIANGELKYKEELTQGLEKVGDVILSVQKGMNKGKAVISVAKD